MTTKNNLDWVDEVVGTFISLKFDVDTDEFSDGTLERWNRMKQTIATMIANQVREARQDALNNWTYKIIGRIQGKELLFADDVREEVQKRREGLQND